MNNLNKSIKTVFNIQMEQNESQKQGASVLPANTLMEKNYFDSERGNISDIKNNNPPFVYP